MNKDKIKVMHIVATSTLSGAEKVVSDICTNLDSKYEPIVICAGEPLKSYYEEKGVKAYIADLSHLKPSEIKKLKNIVKKEKVDIIHAHDVKPSIGGYLAGRKFNVPVISHIHVTYLWMKKKGPLKIIDKHFRKRYTFSIACSEIVRDFYVEYNKSIDENKITYMDNCFNFNEFDKVKIADKDAFREKIGISKDKYVFGFLGRLLKLKGADLMIDAFNEIKDKAKDSILLIVGDGEERSHLEEQVKKYNIEDRVIFAGYQKNAYDYMNTFDTFILPSVREGLPIAVLEAMAMKKPVISTPVAGLRKLIKPDYNGIVLKERNKEELSNAMIKLYTDKELYSNISENAYKYLKENYDIKNYVEKLQQIYEKVK